MTGAQLESSATRVCAEFTASQTENAAAMRSVKTEDAERSADQTVTVLTSSAVLPATVNQLTDVSPMLSVARTKFANRATGATTAVEIRVKTSCVAETPFASRISTVPYASV